MTFPMMTSSIFSGLTPANCTACSMQRAPSSGAGTSARDPPMAPIGVRMPVTMNASPAIAVYLPRIVNKDTPRWSARAARRVRSCGVLGYELAPFFEFRLEILQLCLGRLPEVIKCFGPQFEHLGSELFGVLGLRQAERFFEASAAGVEVRLQRFPLLFQKFGDRLVPLFLELLHLFLPCGGGRG